MSNNGIGKFFNRGVATISVKASSALEKTKYRARINTLNDEIEILQKRIGQKTYASWLNGAFAIEEINEELLSIQAKEQEIGELELRIQQVDENSKSLLGTDESLRSEESVEKRFCPNCGKEYSRPVKYCTECGSLMEE